MMRLNAGSLALLATSLAACGNAGEDLTFFPERGGRVTADVYFDRDGSGDRTPLDTTLPNILVRLRQVGLDREIARDSTDSDGLVQFSGLLPGSYAIEVDTSALGDSVVPTIAPATAVALSAGPPVVIRAGLAPPLVTIAQARASAVGRRVVLDGSILAGVQAFSDTAAFMADASGRIRLQSARNLNGDDFNQPGERVRVRGHIASRFGHPILDSAAIYLVSLQPGAAPESVTTVEASTAKGGTLDAALVRIQKAIIIDTVTVAGAVIVGVNDGTGRLEFRSDVRLGLPSASFAIGDTLDATGVLSPRSPTVWQLRPRATLEFRIY